MKKMYALLLFAAGLAAASCCNSGTQDAGNNDPAAAVIENLMTRTSVRAYTDEPVAAETIEQLLRAGMAAPTAANRQPWAFVVLTEREQLDRLAAVQAGRILSGAPLAIVVCGDMEKALEGTGRDFWVQDTSAATENILLAAHALGLGAVWTGVYPNPERAAAVSEALGLPEQIIPLCVIAAGYPAETPEPKDKWKPENVHYNRW